MKKSFVLIPTVLCSIMLMTNSSCSCGNVCFHTYEIKYDETNHWQECTKCHEKFDVIAHSMDSLVDKCFVCDYKDEIVITNGSHTMTGLTTYAKTKKSIKIPENIYIIGPNAFENSNADTITIKPSLIGISVSAFENSKIDPLKEGSILHPDEPYVEWHYYDGYFYKEDKLLENEALVGDVFYPTLKDAIEAVSQNDTTITLLREDITLDKEINVNFKITLESIYTNGTKINNNTNIYIHPNAYLKIPSNITYYGTGSCNLVLGQTEEISGDTKVSAFTTGSLIFDNADVPYVDYNVNYVSDNSTKDIKGTAVGSTQYVGLLRTKHYVYGICKMSTDLKEIVGLTDFGVTVFDLTIVNPIEGQTFEIGKEAFVVKGQIRVPLPAKMEDIKLELYQQKGFYRSVTIGSGITKIKEYAFSTRVATQIEKGLLKELVAIIAPFTTLHISNDLVEIDHHAFYYCAGLDSVYVGTKEAELNEASESQLKSIGTACFQYCFSLKNVDLSNCKNLSSVSNLVFHECDELNTISLPSNKGWIMGDNSYFPYDMTPEYVSYLFKNTYKHSTWTRDPSKESTNQFAYCSSGDKDAFKKFNKVTYTSTFADALEKCPDGGTIFVCDNVSDANKALGSLSITKSVNLIADSSITGLTIGDINVNKDKYITISNKFTLNGNVTLNCSDDYKSMAGIAIEQSSTNSNDLTVKYKTTKGEESSRQYDFKIGNSSYNAYGLFNFTKNNDNTINLTSLSNLGKLGTKYVVGNPFNGTEYKVTTGNVHGDTDNCPFKDNSNVLEIEIDDSVISLGRNAFGNNGNLQKVTIGKNVTDIGEWTFNGCSKLKTVELASDNAVKNIWRYAFNGCSSLVEFNFNGNVNNWKAGSVSMSSSDLADKAKAATLLHSTYSSSNWARS